MKNLLFGFVLSAALILAVAAVVRGPVTSSADIQIMSGTGVTAGDGTVTNTFAIAFSAVPNVTVSQFGAALSATNAIASVTVTAFVYNANKAAVSNQWIAVGAP